jgi:hypothetical protein
MDKFYTVAGDRWPRRRVLNCYLPLRSDFGDTQPSLVSI